MDITDFFDKEYRQRMLTDEEKKFIRSKIKKNSYRAHYAIYKKESPKGCQLAWILDSDPAQQRKSGYLVQYEVITSREINNKEYDEIIENWGCNNRRFREYIYNNVDEMIYEDQKYNIETPEKFIEECRRRGYSGDYQTKILFN
jgi:hypothetical protein